MSALEQDERGKHSISSCVQSGGTAVREGRTSGSPGRDQIYLPSPSQRIFVISPCSGNVTCGVFVCLIIRKLSLSLFYCSPVTAPSSLGDTGDSSPALRSLSHLLTLSLLCHQTPFPNISSLFPVPLLTPSPAHSSAQGLSSAQSRRMILGGRIGMIAQAGLESLSGSVPEVSGCDLGTGLG